MPIQAVLETEDGCCALRQEMAESLAAVDWPWSYPPLYEPL